MAQLVAIQYEGDFLRAVRAALSQLEGSFAAVFLHKDHPDQMLAVAEKSPLVVGYDPSSYETYVASDPGALAGKSLELYFLENRQIALIKKGKEPLFFDGQGLAIVKEKAKDLHLSETIFSKGIYEHFMLKEIFEQDYTIFEAIQDRFDPKTKTICFEENTIPMQELVSLQQIIIIACGTSFHAACIAAHFFEEICHIATRVEIASEYRYKTPVLFSNTLVIALSQSGETADTLAAMRNIKNLGCKVLALCNVKGSTLAREADTTLFLRAGPEVAVASTKTFTSQIAVLYLLALFFAGQRGVSCDQVEKCFQELSALPSHIDTILHNHRKIQQLAIKYAKAEDFYFLGRGVLYPVALEAALKLKEIAYVNAVGYPAGEMKHGPIALLDSSVPVGVFCANRALQQKIMSNLMESKARGSPILVFGWEELADDFSPVADDVLIIPKTSDDLACILLTIVTQLFAYYVAKQRNLDIDQPRNLAKSVTVE